MWPSSEAAWVGSEAWIAWSEEGTEVGIAFVVVPLGEGPPSEGAAERDWPFAVVQLSEVASGPVRTLGGVRPWGAGTLARTEALADGPVSPGLTGAVLQTEISVAAVMPFAAEAASAGNT